MIKKKLICDVFRVIVYFCCGESYEIAIKHFQSAMKVKVEEVLLHKSPMMGGCVLYIYDEGKCPIYLLWLQNKHDIYALSHECVHLAYRVFEVNGIAVNEHTQEVYANYQEAWMRRLHKIMRGKKNQGGERGVKHEQES